MRTLDANDLALIRAEVTQELTARLGPPTAERGQAFGYDYVLEFVARVVLAIVASLTSKVFDRVVQGKSVGTLTPKQADRLTGEMIGAELQVAGPLDETWLTELKRELLPLGITEVQIQALYERIRQKVRRDDGPTTA
jgi:hypothetical protein